MDHRCFSLNKSKLLSKWPLFLVLVVAGINHLLTFLAYDWYAGIDSYSYDVCGLQLLTGKIFDVEPILFRPPLIPIIKNILYLIFEGHPYALAILIHILGVVTVWLAYRLASRFHKWVGFSMGMLMALNLSIAVYFHQLTSLTFYLPMVILTVDYFIVWMKKPKIRYLVGLTVTTFICCLMRSESVIFIPVFFIFGGINHRNFRQALSFFIVVFLLYSSVCFWQYSRFGYWGFSYKIGYSLFGTVYRNSYSVFNPADRFTEMPFDENNGPACRKIGECVQEWKSVLPQGTEIGIPEFMGWTYSIAQRKFGYFAADRIFWQAAIEHISKTPEKFVKFVFLRMLGHLSFIPKEVCFSKGIMHKDRPTETASGNLWGFEENRMIEKQKHFEHWRPFFLSESPLQWERQVIKARLRRIFKGGKEDVNLPENFRMEKNVSFESGKLELFSCGDGVMPERFWNCRALDVYFFLQYWGQRGWSKTALKLLNYWDNFIIPRGMFLQYINWIMWFLWIVGIFKARQRWIVMVLTALICLAIVQAFIVAIFGGNCGGHYALYMSFFRWLGGLCGVWILVERWWLGFFCLGEK